MSIWKGNNLKVIDIRHSNSISTIFIPHHIWINSICIIESTMRNYKITLDIVISVDIVIHWSCLFNAATKIISSFLSSSPLFNKLSCESVTNGRLQLLLLWSFNKAIIVFSNGFLNKLILEDVCLSIKGPYLSGNYFLIGCSNSLFIFFLWIRNKVTYCHNLLYNSSLIISFSLS